MNVPKIRYQDRFRDGVLSFFRWKCQAIRRRWLIKRAGSPPFCHPGINHRLCLTGQEFWKIRPLSPKRKPKKVLRMLKLFYIQMTKWNCIQITINKVSTYLVFRICSNPIWWMSIESFRVNKKSIESTNNEQEWYSFSKSNNILFFGLCYNIKLQLSSRYVWHFIV